MFYLNKLYKNWKKLWKQKSIKINRDNLNHKTGDKKRDKKYNFQKFKTVSSFRREVFNDELRLEDALEEQIKFK